MAAFLLEAYIATVVGTGIEALAMRARVAAEGLSAAGRPIRCIRSILVAEDDTCFFLFEAAAADDVREVAERAELPFCRISDALTDGVGESKTECRPGADPVGTREAGGSREDLNVTNATDRPIAMPPAVAERYQQGARSH